MSSSLIERQHIYLILILCVVSFSISLARPFLNYDPEPEFTFKPVQSIPLGWQYDVDFPEILMPTAFFPEYYRFSNLRVNRPVYSALGFSFGNAFYFPAKYALGLIKDPKGYYIEAREEAKRTGDAWQGLGFIKAPTHEGYSLRIYIGCIFLGLLLTNFLTLLFASLLLYWVAKQYVDKRSSLIGALLLPFSSYTLSYGAEIHYYVIQPFIAISTLALLVWYLQKKNWKRLIIIGLSLGVLALFKQTYIMFGAALLVALFHLRILQMITVIGLQTVPQLLWVGLVGLLGMEYYHHEIQHANMGLWVFDIPFSELTSRFLTFLSKDSKTILDFFGIPTLILSLIGLISLILKQRRLGIIVLILLVGLVGMTVFQTFLAKMNIYRFVSDMSVLVYALAGAGIVSIVDSIKISRYQSLAVSVVFAVFIYISNTLNIMHFPYVSPFDIPERLWYEEDTEEKKGLLR